MTKENPAVASKLMTRLVWLQVILAVAGLGALARVVSVSIFQKTALSEAVRLSSDRSAEQDLIAEAYLVGERAGVLWYWLSAGALACIVMVGAFMILVLKKPRHGA